MNVIDNKRSDYCENILIMLCNKSMARADYAGLMVHMRTQKRFDEMIQILISGTSAKWWLSTRLLLGLSHDEAVEIGRKLKGMQNERKN